MRFLLLSSSGFHCQSCKLYCFHSFRVCDLSSSSLMWNGACKLPRNVNLLSGSFELFSVCGPCNRHGSVSQSHYSWTLHTTVLWSVTGRKPIMLEDIRIVDPELSSSLHWILHIFQKLPKSEQFWPSEKSFTLCFTCQQQRRRETGELGQVESPILLLLTSLAEWRIGSKLGP